MGCMGIGQEAKHSLQNHHIIIFNTTTTDNSNDATTFNLCSNGQLISHYSGLGRVPKGNF